MKKEEIGNRELERLIAMKVGKVSFSEVTNEDLSLISDITLNSYLINGKKSEITLASVLAFPNLKDLTISNYRVTQEILDLLGALKKLERLHFVNILFEGDIKFHTLAKKLRRIGFINCGELEFDYPSVTQVYIERSSVDFGKIDFSKVKRIFIQNSSIKNAFDLNEYNIESVNLDGTTLYDKNGNIIGDISVGEATFYTHQSDEYKYDRGLV